jgi:hypothetical protein
LDLIIGFSKLQVDLAGEKIISAEKGMVKIAVVAEVAITSG